MTLSSEVASAAGLGVGYGLDRLFGDPGRGHPVAGFGLLAERLERRWYADDRVPGAVFALTLVGGAAVLGGIAERATRDRPGARLLGTALTTWLVLGGRSLEREALIISGQLRRSDLAAARQRVSNLVGRDPTTLDTDGVVRACVESVAENSSDAVVAPLVWGAVAGLPGLASYRAVNTLDAMVGHRSARYTNFGWAAARLDDLANWLPARLASLLAVVAAPAVDGSWRRGLRTAVRYGRQHPSPNAGVVEAAFAGVLGVRLGGRNVYHGQVDVRPSLGTGRSPAVGDISRATRLASVVGGLGLVLAVVIRLARRRQ